MVLQSFGKAMGKDFVLRKHEASQEISLQIFALLFSYLKGNYMGKRIVLFEISGADFLCIPYSFIDHSMRYKLCWVKKIGDYFDTLSIDYEVICYVDSILDAKEKAKLYLELFST